MISEMRFFKALAVVLLLIGLAMTPASAAPIKIVALGDSLMAGYRLDPGEAFPDQLQRALRARGHDVSVINAGVSGDTASGGLERLAWAVPPGTDAVILGLGANDALRGVQPEKTYEALTKIVAELKRRHVKVLIAGMQAPPNMGPEFVQAFNRIHSFLSEYHGVPLYPFFLDGVAAQPLLNQADGVHPTAEGIAEIVERILPYVERMIEDIKAAGG